MLEVKVLSKQSQAEGVVSFELASVGGQRLPAFTAGAHIDVHIPGGPVRQYSLFNAASETHRYCIGILRDPASRGGSRRMHDTVPEGEALIISEPRNHFPLEPGARRSLLFAGGIGVTPLLCMADQLSRDDADFVLHYCGRSLSRMAFLDLLKHAHYSDRVHLHADDGPDDQRFDARQAIGAPDEATHLYVCGPTGYMEHVLTTARALGWPEERLHREYFAGATIDHSADDAFDVVLGRSGRVIRVEAEQSVAQALANAGVTVEVSCEQGVCGTCMTKVLEGRPDHRDMYLTDAERARNDCFLPCCSRSLAPRLTVDL
jgi:vanillate O-demethylase ferredoxin subunit